MVVFPASHALTTAMAEARSFRDAVRAFLDEPQDVPLTGVSGFLPEPEEGTFTRIGLNDFYDLLMEQQEQM